jgi:ABC-type sulfate transport system substrate-binding protein
MKFWRHYDHKAVSYEAGDQNLTRYLELLTTAEKTTLFAQFLSVSHEVKFETKVKDKFLTIYLLRMYLGPLHKIISTDLSLVSEF